MHREMGEDAELTPVLTKPLFCCPCVCAKEKGDLKYQTPCLESFVIVSGFFLCFYIAGVYILRRTSWCVMGSKML